MIEAVGLTRRYGKQVVVDSINLNIPAGAFYGFLGPNGAGKSTTIRMLTGALAPTSGAVRIDGIDPAHDPLAVKRRIGVMAEEPVLYEKLTAAEFLEFAGRMHGLSQPEAIARANDLIDLLDLAPARDRLIADYSMGMKKKTALAAALIHRPRVLFLDEPFNGMDTFAVQAISSLLRQMTENGATVFFSSHIMATVEKLCTRVSILTRGRIVAEGTLADLRSRSHSAADATLEQVFISLTDAGAQLPLPTWLQTQHRGTSHSGPETTSQR